ncbi:urease accessory protein [Haloactinospora alba]|uniref:Urease accessory protein n=1 Tax=Haloactinospora alba TaxID=405555 RepID=A0A543NED6_9ACTN|nr:urease accessory UreF family protein [Haloactinospora alba]TQN30204.1 urease accessory protein [Haloactinospora alba]
MIEGTGELGALLLADGRLPTGGHAHSATLEAALAAGLDTGDIPDYIRARARGTARTEAAAAVLALRAARTDPVDYGPVQAALAARTPSRALRDASSSLGRGLERLATSLRPDHPAVAALGTAAAATPGLRVLRPVALAALGAAFAVPEAQLARVAVYEDAQTVASAALKLRPDDPHTAVRWVVEAAGELDEAARAAAATTALADMPARCSPQLDQWAGDHTHATRRLFVA